MHRLMPLLPRNKPNHLLGIADPESCASVVPLGVDTMDSAIPRAREARAFIDDAGRRGDFRHKVPERPHGN